MRDMTTLDAVDRALIHALHLDGRAPFTKIGDVLGVSTQTVARRYRRLRAEASLRVVGLPDPQRAGQAELFDLEDGLTLRVGDAGKWGEDYRERLQAHRDAIREACRHAGWTLTLHRTDRPASEGVLRIASLIAASRGGPAG